LKELLAADTEKGVRQLGLDLFLLFCGNTSTMRSIALAVSLVWSVAMTRCPVSAAVIAREMDSRSLISPIMITSGSCLRTRVRACLKLLESLPISLWWMRAFFE
jgi:hypothetical protein